MREATQVLRINLDNIRARLATHGEPKITNGDAAAYLMKHGFRMSRLGWLAPASTAARVLEPDDILHQEPLIP